MSSSYTPGLQSVSLGAASTDPPEPHVGQRDLLSLHGVSGSAPGKPRSSRGQRGGVLAPPTVHGPSPHVTGPSQPAWWHRGC